MLDEAPAPGNVPGGFSGRIHKFFREKIVKYPIADSLQICYHFSIQVDYAYSTKNRHMKLK